MSLIWCTGFLLTMAVAYYLVDICFKIGFAVIAMPIVVGLWPFNMTKGKFTACVSIIFKAAATEFAFLAMTSYYAMRLISAGLEGTPTTSYAQQDDGQAKTGYGLEELYAAIDTATNGVEDKAQMELVSERLAVFSIDFIILLFCFIYAFKLIGGTGIHFCSKILPRQSVRAGTTDALLVYGGNQMGQRPGDEACRSGAGHCAAPNRKSGNQSRLRRRKLGKEPRQQSGTRRNTGRKYDAKCGTSGSNRCPDNQSGRSGSTNNKPGNCQCRKRHKVSVTSGKRYSGCRTGLSRAGPLPVPQWKPPGKPGKRPPKPQPKRLMRQKRQERRWNRPGIK
ncbi:MAG: hypothetical protein ACLU99_02155 [Alphaproteobacteria bacterium]